MYFFVHFQNIFKKLFSGRYSIVIYVDLTLSLVKNFKNCIMSMGTFNLLFEIKLPIDAAAESISFFLQRLLFSMTTKNENWG